MELMENILWPQSQAHFGYATTHESKAHRQVYLWKAEKNRDHL